MKVDSNYIDKHLAQLEAIKLRAIEINNLLFEVTVEEDWREYDWCGVAPDWLDVSVSSGKVELDYDDGDWPRTWCIPVELFDYSDEELVNYVKIEAKRDNLLQQNLEYARLQTQAKELGYRLVKEENNDNN